MSACLVLACASSLGLVLLHQQDLRSKLGQALADERGARQAQEAARMQIRIGDLRAKVQELFSAGETALVAQDWENAQLQLSRARDQVSDVPEMADLKSQIAQSLEQTHQKQLDGARLN